MRDYGYPCPYSRFGCREKVYDYDSTGHVSKCFFKNGGIDVDEFLRKRRRANLRRSWPLLIPAIVVLGVLWSILRFHLPRA